MFWIQPTNDDWTGTWGVWRPGQNSLLFPTIKECHLRWSAAGLIKLFRGGGSPNTSAIKELHCNRFLIFISLSVVSMFWLASAHAVLVMYRQQSAVEYWKPPQVFTSLHLNTHFFEINNAMAVHKILSTCNITEISIWHRTSLTTYN